MIWHTCEWLTACQMLHKIEDLREKKSFDNGHCGTGWSSNAVESLKWFLV